MRCLQGKTIALGVCGGIAAYRACDLIRELYRRGAKRVIPLMSADAQAFIPALTLSALSREPVFADPLAVDANGVPLHIALAQQADALLILPATASTIARMAHGLGDDLVSLTALTFTGKPIVIAPAMNTRMWENPLTQRNVETLAALPNVTFASPGTGHLACGETGDGHLASQDVVLQQLARALQTDHALTGLRVLVSTGGTREPLDPVRVLANRSSGRMGLALADVLYERGADVTLVSAATISERAYPVILAATAAEMQAVLGAHFPACDWLVMAAAVSDFRPRQVADEKIKRIPGQEVLLRLAGGPDILAGLGRQKAPQQRLIGFAAETAPDGASNAERKLREKNLDAVVLNDVSRADIGMDAPDNEVTLRFADGQQLFMPKTSKDMIAEQLVEAWVEKFLLRKAASTAQGHAVQTIPS